MVNSGLSQYGHGVGLSIWEKPIFSRLTEECFYHSSLTAMAELAKHGMSKVQINYEMLRDFAIMMNARQVLTDGVSLFSKMANNCADAATAWRF